LVFLSFAAIRLQLAAGADRMSLTTTLQDVHHRSHLLALQVELLDQKATALAHDGDTMLRSQLALLLRRPTPSLRPA
jgi:hypothetical protein